MPQEHEVFQMVNFGLNSKNSVGKVRGTSPCSKRDSWTLSAQTR